MAATTLFSVPISPRQHPISISSFGSKTLWQPSSSAALTKSPVILLRASSSTSTVDKQEDAPSDSLADQPESIPLGGCKACGKAEIERGCNGEGRIQGGIATVPGFGWWPIKAYRPCPILWPPAVGTGGKARAWMRLLVLGVSREFHPPPPPASVKLNQGIYGFNGIFSLLIADKLILQPFCSEKKLGGRKFKR